MKKKVLFFLLIGLMGFPTISLGSKIVRPWRSTTEIVKSGQSFDVWFDADNGQTINSVVLEGPYNTVNCAESVVSGDWEYDQMSGNRYDTRITVTVPSGTPADRYDLVLNTSSGEVTSYGAVKVVTDYKSDYYIMHISDGHIYQFGYDETVLFARKTEMVNIANIMDCEIIIETGDNMYNVRNHPDREVRYFQGSDTEGIKGMADASAATFLTPGDHDALNANDWPQATEQENADFFNDYWGLQNSCFKYGKGRFMMLNNAWDVSTSSARNHQYQIDNAVSWLQGEGSGGNFFLTAGHSYDKMHEFIDDYQQLDLVLAGDKHHVRTDNPWAFETGRSEVAYIAGSIRDHFEFNLFKVNEGSGSYTAVAGQNGVANVLYSGDQDSPSTWVSNLSLSYSDNNDGSNSANTATIVNHYDFPIMGARIRFVMPKGHTYNLTNASIKQEFEGDDFYIVDATLDVDANSSASVEISENGSSDSSTQSGDIGSILCWHYKEIYGGHDYDYNQSILKKRFPNDDTHWSDNLQWWENVVEEIEYSGLDYVALLSRGNQPNAPDRGNGNPKHIPKLIDAMQKRGAESSFKIAIFDDVPNSWTGSKNWNESGGTYYSTTDPKFDLANTANYVYIWDYNLKQVYEHVPDEMRYKIDGRPVIFFWNLRDTWFTNIEGNLKPVLDYIRSQCQADFGFDPFIIVQSDWFNSDPQLNKSDVDAVHGWFSSANGISWSLVDENNYKIGVTVPGLRGPTYSDHLDPAMGTDDNGARLRYGLDNTVGAGARTTLIEGFTNAAESAALWRSNDQGQSTFYDYHNQRLNIVRSYTNNPFPDTLKVEAEACDFNYDLSSGNTGGAYLYAGDLDVIKCLDNLEGWHVTDTEAGEWMEWKEMPLLAENSFELRYKSTASSSVKISIDGNDLPTQSLTSTGGAWSAINIGSVSFPSNGLHTVRLTIVSGTPDINYFNRTSGIQAKLLETLQAEDANYSGAVVATNHAGYNGTGFIEYVDNSGSYIEWTVNAPAAGSYDLSFRYALPNGGRPLQLKVNGVEMIDSLDFPGTGDWYIWDTVTTTQTLNEGNNTVRLTTIGFNGANIDELSLFQDDVPVTDVSLSPASATLAVSETQQLTATVEPSDATNPTVSWSSSNTGVVTVDSTGLVTALAAGSATITVTTEDGNKTDTCAITVISGSSTQTLQAEDAVFDGPIVETNQTGYNGTGFLDFQNASGDYIEWTVNLPSATNYNLTFRYAQGGNNRPLQLKVNGVEVISSMDFPTTSDWSIWETVTTTQALNSGNNTIRLTAIGSSGGNYDEMTVEPEANYLDECEELTGWSTSGGNSLSLNSDAQQGVYSVEMTGSETNEFQKVFSTPFNSGATASNGVVEFWYYISDVSLMGTNQVELGSGGQADVDEYNWSLSGLTNGWNHIVLNISDANMIGNPDLGAINWFRFYNFKSGSVTSKIDGIKVYDDLKKSSSISEVEPFETEKHGIRLYPNPAYDFVKIISNEQITEISLYSLSGELQMKRLFEGEKEIELNVSNLNPGLYMLIIDNKSHKLIVR